MVLEFGLAPEIVWSTDDLEEPARALDGKERAVLIAGTLRVGVPRGSRFPASERSSSSGHNEGNGELYSFRRSIIRQCTPSGSLVEKVFS